MNKDKIIIIFCCSLIILQSINFRSLSKEYNKTIDGLLEEINFYRKYRTEDFQKKKELGFFPDKQYYTHLAVDLKSKKLFLEPLIKKLQNRELEEVGIEVITPKATYQLGEEIKDDTIIYMIYWR